MLYPTVSNFVNEWQNAETITTYEVVVENTEKTVINTYLEEALAYNARHRVNTIVDAFEKDELPEESQEYENLLNPSGNGVMGYIVIPKIDVELAVYHGVRAEALENGIGHIEGTSLPVGGESTHAVLSGHRGLPGAKLFTDLDQIETGDKFYLTSLDETFAYEVDQIKVVEPTQTEDLAIEEGKDLVTLVTCTPYGVNSHRLLIRGHRIPYEKAEQQEKRIIRKTRSDNRKTIVLAVGTAVSAVILLIIVRTIVKTVKRRKKKDPGSEKESNI